MDMAIKTKSLTEACPGTSCNHGASSSGAPES